MVSVIYIKATDGSALATFKGDMASKVVLPPIASVVDVNGVSYTVDYISQNVMSDSFSLEGTKQETYVVLSGSEEKSTGRAENSANTNRKMSLFGSQDAEPKSGDYLSNEDWADLVNVMETRLFYFLSKDEFLKLTAREEGDLLILGYNDWKGSFALARKDIKRYSFDGKHGNLNIVTEDKDIAFYSEHSVEIHRRLFQLLVSLNAECYHSVVINGKQYDFKDLQIFVSSKKYTIDIHADGKHYNFSPSSIKQLSVESTVRADFSDFSGNEITFLP